jgi:hypothetical protein
MKEVKGFVAIAQVPGVLGETLYGPPKEERLLIENVKTNGLTPFKNRREARLAAEHIKARGNMAEVGSLSLRIPETEGDLEGLRKLRGLIVIVYSSVFSGSVDLIGAVNERGTSAYPMPGSWLETNGFESFKSYEAAEWTRNEASRQMQSRATIAWFRLRRNS